MVNSQAPDKFKRGSLYDITIKNTFNETVFDSSLTANGNLASHQLNDSKRYSVYGIKLTDSCINGIMDFMKAKTSDPTNCVSELEISQNISDSMEAKIFLNQHNLRDKQKIFNLRTIDDCSSNAAAVTNNNHETSSRQDITVGVKFSNDFKKMISIGSINQKLVVMGNSDSFNMTMKKFENQAQQREKSKAKYIKPATANIATNTSMLTRKTTSPMMPLIPLSSRGSMMAAIKDPLKARAVATRSSTKLAQLSTMNIRNISKSSNVSNVKNMTHTNNAIKIEEYSLKDHVIFNLILSPMTIDELCDKVSKNTKQSISKTTMSHLIKNITKHDETSKTCTLVTKSHKTPAQIEKWPFYSDEERLRIKNNDEANNIDGKNDFKPSSVTITKKNQESVTKIEPQSISMSAKRTIDKIGIKVNSTSLDNSAETINSGSTSLVKSRGKQPKLGYNNNSFLEFNKIESSQFINIFPAIKDMEHYHKYVDLYDKLYPSYSELKIQFDQQSARGKSLHDLCNHRPHDESIKRKLEEEERKLNNDMDFLNLYSEVKFLHCKLDHLKTMINSFDERS